MTTSNKENLKKPIINRVILLNELILKNGSPIPKAMKLAYLDTLQKNASILYIQAMRQLNGKDYYKRCLELIEEVQAMAYLIYTLKGWSINVCSQIDKLCDNILEDLSKIKNNKIEDDER